jgi:hypothetical protein
MPQTLILHADFGRRVILMNRQCGGQYAEILDRSLKQSLMDIASPEAL